MIRATLLSAVLAIVALAVAPCALAEPAQPLPPMNFFASVAGDELFAEMKKSPAFVGLDKELLGAPITLRVTHTLQPTAGGKATGLLSAIWAGGTLGLLPMVTNNNLVLQYEVRVNGKLLTSVSFQRSFTRAVNIWKNDDPTHGLGQDGLDWAVGTATEAARQLAASPELAALTQEYAFYFGS